MAKILLVEDDLSIIKSLKELLEAEGFNIVTANRQAEALRLLGSEVFDMILLDISLPDGSGYAVCSSAKAQNSRNKNKDIPIIFITAYDDEASTVTGLDMGAEDYITKPFRPRELVSRVKNTLRRHDNTKTVINIEDIQIDTSKANVHRNGEEIYLSVLEYKILLFLINNRGVVVTRSKLLEEIWDIAGDYVNDNTLTVYIKRLREKIEINPQKPEIIKTVRGLGYKIGE